MELLIFRRVARARREGALCPSKCLRPNRAPVGASDQKIACFGNSIVSEDQTTLWPQNYRLRTRVNPHGGEIAFQTEQKLKDGRILWISASKENVYFGFSLSISADAGSGEKTWLLQVNSMGAELEFQDKDTQVRCYLNQGPESRTTRD